MVSLSNNSMGETEYLKKRAQLYKQELDIILGHSKHQIPLGKEYCISCDPRFRLLQTPEKTRNNLLLQQQLNLKDNHLIFRRSFKFIKKTIKSLKI